MSDPLSDEQTTKRTVRRRASSSESDIASLRKRAVRTSAPVKRAVRNAVTEKAAVSAKVEESASEAQTTRKAPTPLAGSKAHQRQKNRSRVVVAVVLLIGVGASAAVGFTDGGQIDVNKTIEARNERIRNNQADDRDTLVSSIEVPVQNTNQGKADGGLVGLGKVTPTPPPVAAATTTASSTDSTASSTDAVASSTAQSTQEEETVDEAQEATSDSTDSESNDSQPVE